MSEAHEESVLVREFARLLAKKPDRLLSQGVVYSMEGSTCTIQKDNDDEMTPGFSWLVDAYEPMLFDTVWIIDGGPGARFIIGQTAGPRTGEWTALVLQNAWAVSGGLTPSYRYRNGDLELAGRLSHAPTPAYPSTLFTVPSWAAYSGGLDTYFLVVVSTGVAYLHILANGDVQAVAALIGNTHLGIFLDGIRLPVRPYV